MYFRMRLRSQHNLFSRFLQVLEAQRSGVQPFAGQHPPPGLEILIRFCCTSDADLGYNPLVAEAMRIGGKLVSDMRLVAVKPNGAKVMAGKWDGRDVVLKTSTRTAREVCSIPHLHCI